MGSAAENHDIELTVSLKAFCVLLKVKIRKGVGRACEFCVF